jgi:hypothetical protein
MKCHGVSQFRDLRASTRLRSRSHQRPRARAPLAAADRKREFRSASELAAHEKLSDSFVARMLCLTLLAPDITQAILEGRQPKGLKLATLLRGVPLAWEEQRNSYGIVDTATSGLYSLR